MAMMPSFNGGAVVHAYIDGITGEGADPDALMKNLRGTFSEVKDGNLQCMEAMLISQAAALQTIFASLARKARDQDGLREFETYLGLALKAQAQSRVTITALIDMKNPRQSTFVSQANIANGPQQVNNGAQPDGRTAPDATQQTGAKSLGPPAFRTAPDPVSGGLRPTGVPVAAVARKERHDD